jgi:hypothetical protein
LNKLVNFGIGHVKKVHVIDTAQLECTHVYDRVVEFVVKREQLRGVHLPLGPEKAQAIVAIALLLIIFVDTILENHRIGRLKC